MVVMEQSIAESAHLHTLLVNANARANEAESQLDEVRSTNEETQRSRAVPANQRCGDRSLQLCDLVKMY